MSKSYFSSNTRILIVFVFTTLLSVVVWAWTPNAVRGEAGMSSAVVQTKERVLKQSSFPEEPMKVVSVKAKGKNIEVGKKFLEESDWLKSLTIKLKNLSNKPIVFFEVSLNFPAVEADPYGPAPGYAHDLPYGRNPFSQASEPLGQKPIMPNETVEITLTEEDQETIALSLVQLGFNTDISYVRMLLRTVVFGDDTMWRAGQILRSDPNEPGTWKVVHPHRGISSNHLPTPNGGQPQLNSILVPDRATTKRI